MALRHYDGPGLPGTTVHRTTAPPTPPAPIRVEVTQVTPVEAIPGMPTTAEMLDRLQEAAINTGQRADETKDHQIYALELCHLPSNTVVAAMGLSPEDALQAAVVKLETALPIKALVWDDGSPVDGIARVVLSEALEAYGQVAPADPHVRLMIGRLKGALGE